VGSCCYYNSPLGILEIKADAEKVSSIFFVDEAAENFIHSDAKESTDKCVAQFAEYFEGKRKSFDTDYLEPQGINFQN